MAGATTGFFGMRASGPALELDVQLRPGRAPSSDLRDRLHASLERYAPGLPSRLHLFAHAAFPAATTYERKHAYLPR